MTPQLIFGIDNGLSGGIAAVSVSHGSLIDKTPMPIRKVGSEKFIDTVALRKWILTVAGSQQFAIAIEECPKHANSAISMRSMGTSYGQLVSMWMQLSEYSKLIVTRSGNPKDSWQTVMLGRLPKGETKPAARRLVEKLWPCENWIPKGCRTDDYGMIDAALIAEFARGHKLT